MNLNLGLESLNGSARGAVVPFTPASAIEMQNASEAITNLMASLENYYDAARNAMLVKKAVKKYGKTQSIVALIGQEGLAAAQSFSMEGFWQKTKEFLIRIWQKIKEWWGRFWGMFFSVEKKFGEYISKLDSSEINGSVNFSAPSVSEMLTAYGDGNDGLTTAINTLNTVASNPTDITPIEKYESGTAIETKYNFKTIEYKYSDAAGIKKDATKVKSALTECIKHKKSISDYVDKFAKDVANLKPENEKPENEQTSGNSKGLFGKDSGNSETDKKVKIFKAAAKINTKLVAQLIKALTSYAVSLMSHTRFSK